MLCLCTYKIILSIIISKTMVIKQIFHIKNVSENIRKQKMFIKDVGRFGQNYSVATISAFYCI